MRDLSQHLLDLLENAIAASATTVHVTIHDSLRDNSITVRIDDDGHGMPPHILATATDPYTTSRTSRHVGLGLPLLLLTTQRCHGTMQLTSTVGKGTQLLFSLQHDHWDRPPMGDLAGTLALTIATHDDIRFFFSYHTDHGHFALSSDELRDALGVTSLNHFRIVSLITTLLADGLKAVEANK